MNEKQEKIGIIKFIDTIEIRKPSTSKYKQEKRQRQENHYNNCSVLEGKPFNYATREREKKKKICSNIFKN